MDLRTYTLGELERYLTPLFSKPESLLPLSPLRLQSYLANPRADEKDPVLFEMHHKDKLIGYRTLLPDLYYDRNGVPKRFAWLSGNWVHPDMRRKGISSTLLAEAEERWKASLMYTNYAPDSKALYDNTSRFRLIARREGHRYYLRSNSEELLGNRLKARGLLHMGDLLINQVRENQLKSARFPLHQSISAERILEPSREMKVMISRIQQNALFRRDTEIFNWALNHPWVTDPGKPDGAHPDLNYYFSYKSVNFDNILYEFRDTKIGARGMLWLIRHNRVMSVPYLFSDEKELTEAMAARLTHEMITLGCSHTTIRYPELNASLEKYRRLFLSKKQMPQLIFAHEKLLPSIPEGSLIHDGDGDVMFTG